MLGTLLALNVLVLVWRLVAAGQAFLDPVRAGPTGRLGIVGLVVIAIIVVIPHLVVYRYGTVIGDTFGRIFDELDARGRGPGGTGPGPGDGQRINVLLIGVDSTRTGPRP